MVPLSSSLDEMDVPVELLTDDAWAAEDDQTGLLDIGLDYFGQLYILNTTNILDHDVN